MRTDRRVAAGLTASAVLLVVAVAADRVGRPPARLVSSDVETTAGIEQGKVGRWANFGITGAEAEGDRPVRVTDVTLRGVPDGLRVVGVYAQRIADAPVVGALEGDLRALRPGVYDFRPVTDAVIRPGPQQEWYFVATLVATRPGTFVTEGVEIRWRVGRHTGTVFYRQRFSVTATA